MLDDFWVPELLPTIAAYECKPYRNCKPNSTELTNAAAQLAASIHPTLVLLVLWYLDTASTKELPPWMFIYGIIYTEKGFNIYAHHPICDNQGLWGFRQVKLSSHYEKIFEAEANGEDRCMSLQAFLAIRSHGESLVDRFKGWNDYGIAIKYLQGQAVFKPNETMFPLYPSNQ